MRLRGAGRGIALAFLGLGIAALLDAHGLRKTAEIQPQGTDRVVAVAVTRQLARASAFLHLDWPQHQLQVAIGRRNQDRIDTRVTFRLPPPAGPLPHPARHIKAPRPVFRTGRPLRIWVAGDSLAQVPGEALERVAAKRRSLEIVGVESRLSTGLGQPALYNWFTRIAEAIPQLRPNAAVLSFGADDAHDYLGGLPKGRRIGPLGSPSWKDEYLRRVDGVIRELNASGVYVVWLGLPVPDSDSYARSFSVVNDVLRRAVQRHRRRAAYIDTWHMLDNGHSGFAAYLPDAHGHLVLMRAADGIHYTAAAGNAVARAILSRLRSARSRSAPR